MKQKLIKQITEYLQLCDTLTLKALKLTLEELLAVSEGFADGPQGTKCGRKG